METEELGLVIHSSAQGCQVPQQRQAGAEGAGKAEERHLPSLIAKTCGF